jgi:hypothetical protein
MDLSPLSILIVVFLTLVALSIAGVVRCAEGLCAERSASQTVVFPGKDR